MRTPGGGETERHVLVDGGNLLHRAYYSYVVSRAKSGRPPFMTSSGVDTGVVFGSLQMLSSWMHDMGRVSRVSVFFDGRPSRRIAADPSYKSNRIHDTGVHRMSSPVRIAGKDASSPQDVLTTVMRLLGCDVYWMADEEADDMIASFCASHLAAVKIIVSDDKDFFQLLTDPRTVVYRPGSPEKFLDAEASTAHWAKLQGGGHPPVPPSHVRMFKSLCGDPSDGIKGVDRLRKRVAVPLCHHKTVDELFDGGLPGLSGTEVEKTVESRPRVTVNHNIVGLRDDIDVTEHVRPGSPDFGSAMDMIRGDLEMNNIDVSGFRSVFGKPSAATLPVPDWLSNI